MVKAVALNSEYENALITLGEKAFNSEGLDLLYEQCERTFQIPLTSQIDHNPLAQLAQNLSLEAPAVLCVAISIYCTKAGLSLTKQQLQMYYYQLGARYETVLPKELFCANSATLNTTTLRFLFGIEPQMPTGVDIVFPIDTPAFFADVLLNEIQALFTSYVQAPYPLAVAICGNEGSGRKTLIYNVGSFLSMPLLLLDMQAQPDKEEILFYARLYGAAICFATMPHQADIKYIISHLGFAFLICDDQSDAPQNSYYTTFIRKMPELTKAQRQQLTDDCFKDIINADNIAPRVYNTNLNQGAISQLASTLLAEQNATGAKVADHVFAEILLRYSKHHLEGCEYVHHSATLQDLVIAQELQAQLTQLAQFVKHRSVIYDTYGFGHKLAWGKGLSVLFYGAPGTGKSMAAAALANETGLPLMRVDISKLISKYIGETQKNLGKVFDDAEKSNCILFFDEADALFSKRSDTADAQDKYANAETAYLLQRLEHYSGVCILATNLLQNFDEAFRRRISYMLHFSMPTQDLRKLIWQGIFPQQAPLQELDYNILSQLELSGASIKNSALHAAYVASVQAQPVCMSFILQGVKNEYTKLGKSLSQQFIQMFPN